MSGIYGRTVNQTGGQTHDATHRMIVNDTTIVNDTHVGISNYLHHNDGQPDEIKYEFIFTISNISAGTCNAYMEIHNDGETPQQTKQWTGLNAGTYKHTLYWNYKVGGPDGTPTYFETLDKLDQWSSAQYIPDMRNSRNKLNL